MTRHIPVGVLAGLLVLQSGVGFAQGRSAASGAAPQANAGRGGGPGQLQTDQEKKNVAVVMGFWKEIWEGRDPKAAPTYMSPTYVEHNDNGTNGLANWTRERPLPPPDQRVRVASQRIYARSDFVVMVQNRERGNPQDASKLRKYNQIEMFRVYDGLLQEHWMMYPSTQGAPPNANGQPGQAQTGQEKKNIAVTMGFWKEVWENRGDPTTPPKWMAPSYMEHNNGATNGLGVWTRGRAQPPANQPPLPRPVVTSNTIYARNDFVLLLQDREGPDPANPSRTRKINMIEMFRVYDNLLQEHWMFFPFEE